jgi:hypothetical protein
LLYWYKSTSTDAAGSREAAARHAQSTQFTCFTGTKVQVLTLLLDMPKALRAATAVGPLFVGVFSGVLILLYMCPHTTIYVSSYHCICVLILLLRRLGPFLLVSPQVFSYYYTYTTIYVSSYHYKCVLVPLYMCPHATVNVSSYHYICVLILLLRRLGPFLLVSPQVFLYYYICVLILLYMCPHHTTIYVSSYHYMCVLMLLYVSSYYCMCPHTTLTAVRVVVEA